MGDARYMYTAGIPANRVGSLLTRARQASGLTQRELAGRVRVDHRALRAWERGERVPTDDQIEAVAHACGRQLVELFPRRGEVTYDPDTGVMRLGDRSMVLSTATRDNDDVLGAFLLLVREQRHAPPNRELAVRIDDLEALAEALDLDDDELEERLIRVIGLTRRQAAAVRAQLLRRRLTVGVVGMLAGISLVAANRAFTTGTERVDVVAGGRLVRGNPFVAVTTAVARAVATTAASATTTVVISSAAPQSTTASATLPPVTASLGPSPTLPAVVLAEQVEPETGHVGRTGPPRTTPLPEFSPPVTKPTEPETTTPTTVVLAAPPTLDPPATTGAPATTTTTTGPPDTPPVATTSGPVVPTIGGGGTTATTEAPPPTTTTTEPPPTTTTTEPPPTTTTTEPPPTTTTTEPPPTTTTTEVPPTTLSGP